MYKFEGNYKKEYSFFVKKYPFVCQKENGLTDLLRSSFV